MFDLVITLCLVFGGVLNTVGATLGMQGLKPAAIACLIVGCAFMTVAVITQIADICNKSKVKGEENPKASADYSGYFGILNNRIDSVWRFLNDNGMSKETTLAFGIHNNKTLAVCYYYNGGRNDVDTGIPVEKPADFHADTDIKVITNTRLEVKFEYDKALYLIDKASGNCHVIVSTKENKK